MKIRIDSRCLVVILALVLLMPGCKKAKVNSDNSPQQSGNNNPITNLQNQGSGGAVQNVRNAVLRVGVENDLKQLSLLYTNYTLTNSKPPTGLADLPEVKAQLPKLYEEITNGDVIVYWNADASRLPSGSNTVFAHVKTAPNASTLVARLDGSVSNLSPTDFANAPKAGK